MQRSASSRAARGHSGWLALGVLVGLMEPAPAAALESPPVELCPAIPGGSLALAQIDAETRLRFIRENLRRSAHGTRVWMWVWGSAFAGSIAINLGLTPVRSHSSRIDGYVSAGSSGLGLVVVVLRPLEVVQNQSALERRLAAAGTGGDRCALLADAEVRLERAAENQRFGHSGLMHAANALYNLGVATALGLGLQHWEYAGIFLGAALFTGELRIATLPNDLPSALEQYRAGQLRLPAPPSWRQRLLQPRIVPQGLGLGLAWSF